jgi:aminoglycoside/choline kinase family phosphotransferase
MPNPMSDAPPTRIAWTDPARQAHFERWLHTLVERHGLLPATLCAASADASFRRYFRIDGPGRSSFVVMDAPPPQEDVRRFMQVAGLIGGAGLHAPEVLAADVEQGFLLLSDLGRTLYLDALRDATPRQADTLMRDALRALVQFQSIDAGSLPPFDAALMQRELALFPEWCVRGQFGITWTDPQRESWQRLCTLLVDSALAQPQLAMHRDWMPRNLMLADPNPGILDFQDAVRGPISYDMASLLRDAFISWDEEREIDWAVRYWEQARRAGLPVQDDFGEFWRALEWMGLQRHLKILGLFCRLKQRDAKPAYAQDLPRFFAYATKVAVRYRPLGPLLALIEPLSGTMTEAGYTF